MRITNFNCAPLQWTRARSTIHLSGYAARLQKGCLTTTGLRTRATVRTARHIDCIATKREPIVSTPKPFSRAISSHSTVPATIALSSTIPEDATVSKVAEILAAHRENVEASSKSAIRRRELASTQKIGLQALIWLQQLDGLDEQHVIPKKLCSDLGWVLVAEGNDQPMISWLLEEGARLKSSKTWVRPNAARYRTLDAYGNRLRRRHDQLAALMVGRTHRFTHCG
jgi:hypothetical protein